MPRNFWHKNESLIALLIITSFVGPKIIDYIFNKVVQSHLDKHKFSVRFALSCTLLLFVDVAIFKDNYKELCAILIGNQFPDGALYYIVFTLLIPYTYWRINKHIHNTDNKRRQSELRLISISITSMFFFLSIVSFATKVYPYISAAKGGGDFHEVPIASIISHQLSANSSNAYSQTVCGNIFTNSYIIIEQTSASYYFAEVRDNGGPLEWRKMRRLPHILEIRREMIDSIFYTQICETNGYRNP